MAAPKTTGPDTSNWEKMGRNVRTQVIDGVLFVAVNIKPDAFKGVVPTEKGNYVIATTSGNKPLEGTTLSMGVNIYGKQPAA